MLKNIMHRKWQTKDEKTATSWKLFKPRTFLNYLYYIYRVQVSNIMMAQDITIQLDKFTCDIHFTCFLCTYKYIIFKQNARDKG